MNKTIWDYISDFLGSIFDGTMFDYLDNVVNSTEGSFVNFLTAFAPWIAPLAPAFMTYQHMSDPNVLNFPPLLAFILALLVEILGFGTVSTGLDFWFYNRKETSKVKKAPVWIVIGVFAFYLFLILASNVVIDISKAYLDEWWQKAAVIGVRALLTLQTIPGALIVAVRTGHRELLREIKKEKSQKISESFQKFPESSRGIGQNFPKDWRKLRPNLSDSDVTVFANLGDGEIDGLARKYGVDPKTIKNWRSYSQAEIANKEKNKNEQEGNSN